MTHDELKEIFWKDGKFVDQNGNLIKSVIPIGIPKLLEVNIFNKNKYTIKEYIPLELKSLQEKDRGYAEVNAYLEGDFRDYDDYSTNRTKRYAVSFYKVE